MTTVMTIEDATTIVLTALTRVAPEIDPATVDVDEGLAAGYDLDSIDFLTLVEHVATAVGRDVPERDYPKIGTVASFAAYLVAGADPGHAG